MADSVATDSWRLPVWFSVGTKGSEDKVCNEVFSVALLSSVQFGVVVDCTAALCGFFNKQVQGYDWTLRVMGHRELFFAADCLFSLNCVA